MEEKISERITIKVSDFSYSYNGLRTSFRVFVTPDDGSDRVFFDRQKGIMPQDLLDTEKGDVISFFRDDKRRICNIVNETRMVGIV